MKTVQQFLNDHKLGASYVDMKQLIGIITTDMVNGLRGDKDALRMIPTYIEADNRFRTGVSVVAIDAGGTNFRAAVVRFSEDGKMEISDLVSSRMPGIDGEVSKEKFFELMAEQIKPLALKCDGIGFCFSYPSEILPNKDGVLLTFCKEVQAPEVVGQLIGKTLLETLGSPHKKIVLLNDTVATLLAGKSASFGKSYDSFIGFILGTGTNTCYIDHNSNILKNSNLGKDRSMIINIESGNFSKAPRTDIDLSFDNTTSNPGNYSFEKMFSGGYFGGLCLTALKSAATEGLFSEKAAMALMNLKDLSSGDAGRIASDKALAAVILGDSFSDDSDKSTCSVIVDTLIDRSAKLVAANLAAVLLKTGKGTDP
nr:hypothetical protein [Bacteroidales bacterium]